MHYFKMNIGDYAKKAGRLSMLEHGAYTLLIHACYDRERFPTMEEAFDWCWVRTDEEKQAVEFVLKKFFTLEGDVYVQNRIEEEIDKYHENAQTIKRIATEREEKRRNKSRSVHEACKSVDEPPPNHKPRTTNQEPSLFNRSDAPLVGDETENATNIKNNDDESGSHPSARQSLIPLDFTPDDNCVTYAKAKQLNIDDELDRFRTHYLATGTSKGNWQAALRAWLIKSYTDKYEGIERCIHSPPGTKPSNQKFRP